MPLSERGRRQARRLATLIGEFAPTAALTSDLGRARETAALLGHPDAIVEPVWREAELGAWTGQMVVDLMASDGDGYRAWREGRSTPPGGESWEALVARISEALAALSDRDGCHLVVTHGGPIRAACATLLGLEPTLIVPVSPASVTVIDLDRRPRLRAFNLTPMHAPQETAE